MADERCRRPVRITVMFRFISAKQSLLSQPFYEIALNIRECMCMHHVPVVHTHTTAETQVAAALTTRAVLSGARMGVRANENVHARETAAVCVCGWLLLN